MMGVAFDIFSIGFCLAAIWISIRAVHMSRSVRIDMAKLKCPHCHRPIFPELP